MTVGPWRALCHGTVPHADIATSCNYALIMPQERPTLHRAALTSCPHIEATHKTPIFHNYQYHVKYI